MAQIKEIVETYFANKESITPTSAPEELIQAIATVLMQLEDGQLQVAYKNSSWQINEWVKKAILLYFKITPSIAMPTELTQYYDKIPLRFQQDSSYLETNNIRVVPNAAVRRGTFLAPNVVVMPSFVNIGAYVGANTMVDSFVTVGSCAYVGANVHLSANVLIGGVLEPLQSHPTIIEDNCFIGAGSSIVEGCIIEEGAVIGMGVNIGKSTKIYDRASGNIYYGKVPPYAVVVPGSINHGDYALNCAIIVKQVDAQTRAKTTINELLRHAN